MVTLCYKMPLIQIDISEDIDRQLQYYMLDNKIKDKRFAIETILKNQFKK